MKRAIYWLASNAGFAAAVWFGWWQGIDGARNLAGAYVLLCVLIGLLCLSDQAIKRLASEPPQPVVRRTLSTLVAWFAMGTLLWHGSMVTAAAWALWMLITLSIRLQAQRLRASQEATA